MEAEHVGKKSGWDARQHFSILLVRLIQAIISSAQARDLLDWEMLLWQYYTLTQRFMGRKDIDKINELRKALAAFKNKSVIQSGSELGLRRYNREAGDVLMQYQELLFYSTAHLLMPIQEDDSEDDFDVSKLINQD
jgi:hypothetical protein